MGGVWAASRASARRGVNRFQRARPRTLLLAAWAFMLVYAFPGYMNWDSGDQLHQLRTGTLDDWHPAVMAAYWRLIEHVVRGPFGMLVLQSALFLWGLYELLRHRLEPRPAAWLAAGLYLFPPLFTPMAVVWKDAQMAAFLVAGLALTLRPSWRARIVGLALLLLATAVRDNAPAALPGLMLWVAAGWGHRPWLRKVAVAAALSLGLFAAAHLANRAVTDKRAYAWYTSSGLFDLAGTLARTHALTDPEVRRYLDGTGIVVADRLQERIRAVYTPRVWFALAHGDEKVWHHTPDEGERAARKRAWLAVIREHPRAYLAHRWAVTRQLLGLGAEPVWEPVRRDFAANEHHLARVAHDHRRSWVQRAIGDTYHDVLGQSLIYRVWAYLVLALVLLGHALTRRDQLVVALLTSGLLYEASFAVVTAAPDFRYSHWLVTCTCVCLFLVFLERLRAGRGTTGACAAAPC